MSSIRTEMMLALAVCGLATALILVSNDLEKTKRYASSLDTEMVRMMHEIEERYATVSDLLNAQKA